MSEVQGNKKIDVIDGLRGLAILMVIFHHTLGNTALSMSKYFVFNGWLGVNLFFILSGFVLFKPYAEQTRKLESSNDLFTFYKKRFYRLFPLFIFNCLICYVFYAKPDIESTKTLLLTLSTLGTFSDFNFIPPINWVLWSLQLEIWFSILFPFIILLMKRWNIHVLFCIILFLSLLTRFIGAYYTTAYGNFAINPIKDSVLGRFDDFFLGILIAHTFYSNSNLFQKHLLFSSIGFILFAPLSLYLWDLRRLEILPTFLVPFLNNLVQISFIFLVIIALNKNNVLQIILRNWTLRICGSMCFSLYLWHGVISVYFFQVSLSLNKYLMYLLVTCLISAITYRYIEFGHEKSLRKLFLLPE